VLQWQNKLLIRLFRSITIPKIGVTPSNDIKAIFDNAIDMTEGDTVIISSEIMTPQYGSWKEHAKTIQFLQKGYKDVEIIVYIRRQDTYCESIYQQLKKFGLTQMQFEEFIESKNFNCYSLNWHDQYNTLKEILINAKVKVFCYEKEVKNGDIFRSFLSHCGVQFIPENVRSKTVNIGLNNTALNILSVCDQTMNPEEIRKMIIFLSRYQEMTKTSISKTYGFFANEKRKSLLTYYQNSNLKLFRDANIGTAEDFKDWNIYGFDNQQNNDDIAELLTQAVQFLSKHIIDTELYKRKNS